MIEKIRKWVKDKTGVSPIIAIILMVAITVVLAATIYVWVTGFGTHSKGPEEASVTCQLVGSNTLKFTLTKAAGNGTYLDGEFAIYVTNASDPTNEYYYISSTSSSAPTGGSWKLAGSDNNWDVGEAIYLSGLDQGYTWTYSVEIKGTTVASGEIYIP